MKAQKYNHVNSIGYARGMDKKDPLAAFRKQFLLPKVKGKPAIYMIGNSLGLQPKTTRQFIKEELDDWANLAGEGHFHARRPWLTYHKLSKKILSQLTGGKPNEVLAMNQLTVNLHLMLVSFYNPTPKRHKILTEDGAFPSDQYAFETHLKFHGLDPETSLIEIKPREGEYFLRTEDIISSIERNADELALVILGGVQYYTGQFFEIGKITSAAHAAGAMAGFDLAHAIGNVPLQLHDDDVDFAVWCSYKYLNSGPGAIAGAFVHEKYSKDFSRPRFAGWWGHDEDERFRMIKGFKPMEGVDGWQLSNVPILQAAAHQASLEVFGKAGISRLRKKSLSLTGFLEFLLLEIDPDEKHFKIITPKDPNHRGCQLSILMKNNGRKTFSLFIKNRVIADWREPNVIRVAPAPLYNSYEDVFRLCQVVKHAING